MIIHPSIRPCNAMQTHPPIHSHAEPNPKRKNAPPSAVVGWSAAHFKFSQSASVLLRFMSCCAARVCGGAHRLIAADWRPSFEEAAAFAFVGLPFCSRFWLPAFLGNYWSPEALPPLLLPLALSPSFPCTSPLPRISFRTNVRTSTWLRWLAVSELGWAAVVPGVGLGVEEVPPGAQPTQPAAILSPPSNPEIPAANSSTAA